MKNKDISSMITVNEETRRMSDMMKMYSSKGFDPNMFGGNETLVLNANHKLVKYVLHHTEDENIETFCKELYDLAKIMNGSLSPDEMTGFLQRTNEIMLLLTNKADA